MRSVSDSVIPPFAEHARRLARGQVRVNQKIPAAQEFFLLSRQENTIRQFSFGIPAGCQAMCNRCLWV